MKKSSIIPIILFTSLMVLQGCTLNKSPKEKLFYRIIEKDGTRSMVTDTVDKKNLYPDGVDFNTKDEAKKYIDRSAHIL
jgi:hypothetical protein